MSNVGLCNNLEVQINPMISVLKLKLTSKCIQGVSQTYIISKSKQKRIF